jgi:hypothetical protein
VQVQRELTHLRLVQERDAAARQAAESRLHLLQAQIQPHFLFNTLAALQHWVDEGDPRAGPLLADLTAFLRGSTALLARPKCPGATKPRRRASTCASCRRGWVSGCSFSGGSRCGLRGSASCPPASCSRWWKTRSSTASAPALRGGHVQVQARCQGGVLALEVRDNGAGLAEPLVEGLGLSNCRERLQHRYGAQATLQPAAAATRRLRPCGGARP